MIDLINDPKVFWIAFVGGIAPSLFWLWFWLKEDKENPEPKVILAICFIIGMISVILVLPLEQFIKKFVESPEQQIFYWASAEEIIKYLAVMIILYKTSYLKRPIDWPIFAIATALGFAALENILFLIEPLSVGETTVGLLTGNLRFLGSTLLHAVASGIIGIMVGLSFYLNSFYKKIYLLIGFTLAIALHTLFNFFIIKNNGGDYLKVFALLWVATIINLLLFERIRRMSLDQQQTYQ